MLTQAPPYTQNPSYPAVLFIFHDNATDQNVRVHQIVEFTAQDQAEAAISSANSAYVSYVRLYKRT